MEKLEKSLYCLLVSLALLPHCASAQSHVTQSIECQIDQETVLHIDSSRSSAEILVRKTGFLKRFGHDHVVLANQITGYVNWTENLQTACGELSIETDSLLVDDPDARKRYHLDSKPSAKDIQETRENMLTKVLESDKWPEIRVLLHPVRSTPTSLLARASILIHGVKQQIDVPVLTGEDSGKFFTGELELRQSDFEINPFSAAGGGLRIQDKLQIRFKIYVN